MTDKPDNDISYIDYQRAASIVMKVLCTDAVGARSWLCQHVGTPVFEYHVNKDAIVTSFRGHALMRAILGPHGHTIVKAVEARRT